MTKPLIIQGREVQDKDRYSANKRSAIRRVLNLRIKGAGLF